MARSRRPKIAVWKFASCDGCQMGILDLEDELMALSGEVEIAHFLEASREISRGPYDVSLVEGSITTPDDAGRIRRVRRISKSLIAIGACATSGGIQALRNFCRIEEFLTLVYARPDYIRTLEQSSPVSDYVPVDFELRGCPVDKAQIREVLSSMLNGRRPAVPAHSLCVECKILGVPCVMVAQGIPCLGPVTQAGCGSLCPTYRRGCYGCFGPRETANTDSLSRWWRRELGVSEGGILRAFRNFNAGAGPFRKESERHEKG